MGRTTLHQLVAVMLAFAVMVIGPEVIHRFSTPNKSSSLPPPENTPQPSTARAINIQSVPSSPGAIFPPEMAYLLADGEHNDLRHKLTQKAAKDAGRQDEKALAKTLTLLGQAAVESNDLAMAELYFEEALGLHQKTGSVVGVAGVEMSLGLVHLTHRRVAVAAGTSYDRLLVARWKVSHGQLQEAQGEVLDIIRDELKLDRYAAAANAVNTLVRIHKASGDNYLAKDAVVQAMDLYTRAGQTSRAQESFAQLEELGVNETELESIRQQWMEAEGLYATARHNMARADDYRHLFRTYMAKGQPEQAWMLREKATEIASRIPENNRIKRRTDAIAMLYHSNGSFKKASDYLSHANVVFDRHGLDDLSEQSRVYLRQLR